jgi:hypothetical protein
VLFKSVVRCLLSTGAPALRSLHDIWSTPVAFLIVVPLHKKNDPLDKKKLSSCQYSANNLKIYEVVLSDQLVEILIIFFMIVYVLQKGPCMSDHTTETP